MFCLCLTWLLVYFKIKNVIIYKANSGRHLENTQDVVAVVVWLEKSYFSHIFVVHEIELKRAFRPADGETEACVLSNFVKVKEAELSRF